MPTTVETVRDALVKARRERSLAAIAGLPVPATVSEGLQAQAAVGEALGLADAGWKVGIAEDGTAVAGLMPGPFLAPGDVYDGAIGAELRIEIEIALRLARDVPFRPAQAYSRAELLACCDKAYLGIEIVESRLADWFGKVPLELWLVDVLGHGGYYIGPELDMKVLDDLTGHGCFISRNGVTI